VLALKRKILPYACPIIFVLFVLPVNHAQTQGREEEAIQHMERARAQAEQPTNSYEYRSAVNSLLGQYEMRREFEKQSGLANRAIDLLVEKSGPKSEDAIDIMESMANIVLERDPDLALKYAERAGKIRKAVTRGQGREWIRNQALLARIYDARDQEEKAEQLWVECLRQAEGMDESMLTVILQGAAYFYSNHLQPEKAHPLWTRLLSLREKEFGAQSKMLTGVLYDLARISRQLGKREEADALMARYETLIKP
jgi:hypothetical protein